MMSEREKEELQALTFFFVGNHQPFHDAVVLHVLGENFFHVFFIFWGVPHIVRIDDQGRAVLTRIQTPGFVDPHLSFQAHFMDTAFGVVQQIDRPAGRTATSGIILFSLIVADKKVF